MSDNVHKGSTKTSGSPASDGSHSMTGIETAIIGAIPKVLPPAARAVRKQLDDYHDQQAMQKILTQAMVGAADALYSANERPDGADIAKIAKGATNIARTGSVENIGKLKSAWTRRPALIGGYRRRKLQTVGVEGAVEEVALWVRASARDLHVSLPRGDEYAVLSSRFFIEEILKPTPFAVTADFSNRLTKAWLAHAKDADSGALLLGFLGYPALLTGAAVAAAAIFKLPPAEVVQIAEAVGAGSLTARVGFELYSRENGPSLKAKKEAEYIDLLNLLKQIAAFVVDLSQVSSFEIPVVPAVASSTPGSSSAKSAGGAELPDLLIALIDDLDNHLLPEARERAPLLAARLKRVSDQLRLLQQRRPAFDMLELRDAVRDLWQTLERVGYRNRIDVPAPFVLPPDKAVHLALPPPQWSAETDGSHPPVA